MENTYQILKDVNLATRTTFGVPAQAARLVEVDSVAVLQEIIKSGESIQLILGGGSNLLFTSDLTGLVLQNKILGREILEEQGDDVLIQFGGGENWHETVGWTLDQNLFGLENLSLIPGTVGAAPIQNIGAYGVELMDRFEFLTAIELSSGKSFTFNRDACNFAYRYSIFKGPAKGRFFITSVTLRLSRKAELNLDYGALKTILANKNIRDPKPKDVSEAVIEIRQQKLPDPKMLGNAGSFFKNPIIPLAQFSRLKQLYPDVPSYPAGVGEVKVPAGWLIEKAGWKGKRIGNTGCHVDQALVLVNYGNATGREIAAHAERVIHSVKKTFGINLEKEVNVWGTPD